MHLASRLLRSVDFQGDDVQKMFALTVRAGGGINGQVESSGLR